MKKDMDTLLNEFRQFGIIHGESTLTGDYKSGNKAARKIMKIFDMMEQDATLADYLLTALLWHQNNNVRTWAASYALKFNLKTSEAIAVLRQIATKDASILGFNAKMCLEVNGIPFNQEDTPDPKAVR